MHRWGLNEGSGATTADSIGSATGALTLATWSLADKAPIGPGVCEHEPAVGCCDVAADCDDTDPCTVDSCVSGNLPARLRLWCACDDGNAGTCSDTCVPAW